MPGHSNTIGRGTSKQLSCSEYLGYHRDINSVVKNIKESTICSPWGNGGKLLRSAVSTGSRGQEADLTEGILGEKTAWLGLACLEVQCGQGAGCYGSVGSKTHMHSWAGVKMGDSAVGGGSCHSFTWLKHDLGGWELRWIILGE